MHPALVKAPFYCFCGTILELLTIQQIINPIVRGGDRELCGDLMGVVTS